MSLKGKRDFILLLLIL